MSKLLCLIPTGLPGLGKTTLAQQVKQHLGHKGGFTRINYDQMLLNHLNRYQRDNPKTPFHEVIDIIRPLADQEYLAALVTESQCVSTNNILYLDRNNTPDIWGSISTASPHVTSILLTPIQPTYTSHPFLKPNPITPDLFFHCAKRIFSRYSHDCLSAADKPKAIEVLLKFTRLYDNASFTEQRHFSERIEIDYGIDKVCENVVDRIVWGVDRTPGNFEVPETKVINGVLEGIETYIKEIKEKEIIIQSNQQQIAVEVINSALVQRMVAGGATLAPQQGLVMSHHTSSITQPCTTECS
ncbi:hypothetical protein FGO68_gene7919 [Halteria grandinella]|uniref:Uncharacterized protein n=1 Tax=Halteria grandinella TaxID=5974 RepID=A0A8J8NV06_HALGN|nr:hypothetical protein FGO68_gene7919 [Halteria grandinella]